jgi:hypothetical protein
MLPLEKSYTGMSLSSLFDTFAIASRMAGGSGTGFKKE